MRARSAGRSPPNPSSKPWHSLPRLAAGAGERLETRVVSEYPSGTSALAKVRGLAVGLARRRSIARHFTGMDVVHYPFTVPVPQLPLPSVVTLHDLQHLDLPHLFSWQTRVYRRAAYDRAARRADIVIVPSAFVQSRAEDLLGLDPSRVRVVPHGVDHCRLLALGSTP